SRACTASAHPRREGIAPLRIAVESPRHAALSRAIPCRATHPGGPRRLCTCRPGAALAPSHIATPVADNASLNAPSPAPFQARIPPFIATYTPEKRSHQHSPFALSHRGCPLGPFHSLRRPSIPNPAPVRAEGPPA